MYEIITIGDSEQQLKNEVEELLNQILWAPLGIVVDNRDIFFNDKAKEKFYIAVRNEDKLVIGCLVLTTDQPLVEIRHLAVRTDFQNQGVGKSLVKSVLNDWPDRRIDVIIRSTSVRFWERLGFRPSGDWMEHQSFNKHGISFRQYLK